MNTPNLTQALICATLLMTAAASHSREADALPTAGVPSTDTAAAQAQSRRAVRDPETGRLRAPTEEELRTMRETESAARKARGEPEMAKRAPLSVRQHPNGMRSAVLGPDYLMTLKAERRADGKLVVIHSEPGNAPSIIPNQQPTE